MVAHILYLDKIKKIIAESGFDPPTSELWAQHASTAPPRLLREIPFEWELDELFV